MTRPVDAYPWLTEEAIAFLELFLLFRRANVLEFGCGGSTVWLAQRAASVTTIEHRADWAERVHEALDEAKVSATVIEAERPYCDAHESVAGMFDLVLVDGRDRAACIQSVFRRVTFGGVLMLDNAERARYADGVRLLATWKYTSSEQKGPRKRDAFWYPGWRTDWWVRA